MLAEATEYIRVRCGRGSVPSFGFSDVASVGASETYVQCGTTLDSSNTTYDNSIWYNNMNPHDQYFMNIHGCKSATASVNMIPFLVIETTATTAADMIFAKYTLAYSGEVNYLA